VLRLSSVKFKNLQVPVHECLLCMSDEFDLFMSRDDTLVQHR
jgi:hypothetical protein